MPLRVENFYLSVAHLMWVRSQLPVYGELMLSPLNDWRPSLLTLCYMTEALYTRKNSPNIGELHANESIKLFLLNLQRMLDTILRCNLHHLIEQLHLLIRKLWHPSYQFDDLHMF